MLSLAGLAMLNPYSYQGILSTTETLLQILTVILRFKKSGAFRFCHINREL